MSRTLSGLKRDGGISLETLQRKKASSCVEGRISWFFSSCIRKLGVSLVLRQRLQGPARVASGKSSLHESWERPLVIPLHLVLGPMSSSGVRVEPQDSSPVLTWILGFLWSSNRGFRPCLMWRHASSLSSRAGKAVSGFLSS